MVYGGSVQLDITASSLNPTFLNLTTAPVYYAFIYGGDLDTGVTIPLYSENNPPLCHTAFQCSTLLEERGMHAFIQMCATPQMRCAIFC